MIVCPPSPASTLIRAAKKIIAAAEKEGVKIGEQLITTHHRASTF